DVGRRAGVDRPIGQLLFSESCEGSGVDGNVSCVGHSPSLNAVSVRSRLRCAQLRKHEIAKLLGRGLFARTCHDLGQGAGDERLALARWAVLDMLSNRGVLGLAHFIAEVLLQILTGFLAAAIAHFLLLVAAVTIPRSAA